MPQPRRVRVRRRSTRLSPRRGAVRAAAPKTLTDREKLALFWAKQRAAMDAMKRDGDLDRAIVLFRSALERKPDHQDSLGTTWRAASRVRAGPTKRCAHLRELTRIEPQSHRGPQTVGDPMSASLVAAGSRGRPGRTRARVWKSTAKRRDRCCRWARWRSCAASSKQAQRTAIVGLPDESPCRRRFLLPRVRLLAAGRSATSDGNAPTRS